MAPVLSNLVQKGQVHIILDIQISITVKTSSFGKRSFNYAAPVLWNSLEDDFRNCSLSFNQFDGLVLSLNGENCNCIAGNS